MVKTLIKWRFKPPNGRL